MLLNATQRTPLAACRSGGFSMMELLVAVLVMGIGVLGVTGLQLVSLQNNQEALMRSEAVNLAYDILDRIRVNPGPGVPGNAYAGVDFDDDPPAGGDCVNATCSVAQMTSFDLAMWKCSLGGHNDHGTCTGLRGADLLPDEDDQPGLPEGAGEITIDGNGVISVSVRWMGFNNVEQTITVNSQG